jgi:hypothetical protein
VPGSDAWTPARRRARGSRESRDRDLRSCSRSQALSRTARPSLVIAIPESVANRPLSIDSTQSGCGTRAVSAANDRWADRGFVRYGLLPPLRCRDDGQRVCWFPASCRSKLSRSVPGRPIAVDGIGGAERPTGGGAWRCATTSWPDQPGPRRSARRPNILQQASPVPGGDHAPSTRDQLDGRTASRM